MSKDDDKAMELLKKSMPDTTFNEDKERGEMMLDPRQEAFLDYYYEPESETFGKVYQSAIRAGYSESYAKVLRAPAINNKWIRYNKKRELTPEHIMAGIQNIATSRAAPRDKLKAYELLAKLHGMLVERSINQNYNIETALSELK